MKVLEDRLVDFHEDDLLVDAGREATLVGGLLFACLHYDDSFGIFEFLKARHGGVERDPVAILLDTAKELCMPEEVLEG